MDVHESEAGAWSGLGVLRHGASLVSRLLGVSTPASRPDPDLADRYGAPSPSRRRLVVAGATLVVVAFLGWLLWATLFHASPSVSSELTGFDVVDDHTAVARVQVKLSDADDGAEMDASCRITAYAEDHTVVGDLAWVPQHGLQDVDIRTERRATSLELVGCTAEGQPRPR